jgi:hypothetical protein
MDLDKHNQVRNAIQTEITAFICQVAATATLYAKLQLLQLGAHTHKTAAVRAAAARFMPVPLLGHAIHVCATGAVASCTPGPVRVVVRSSAAAVEKKSVIRRPYFNGVCQEVLEREEAHWANDLTESALGLVKLQRRSYRAGKQ